MLKHSLLIASFLVVGLILGLSAPLQAENLVSYQGYLVDNGSNPLSGTYQLTFKIYDVPSSGTALWSEIQPSVSVTNGLFSVQLGSITPLAPTVFSSSPRYLGITVAADPEISPRVQLTSVPFASKAATVEGFFPGSKNSISGLYGFTAGDSNTVITDYSSIAGGYGNYAELINVADSLFDTTGIFSKSAGEKGIMQFSCNYPPWWTPIFIGGGFANVASGNGSGIGWGGFNQAMGGFSTIGGGGTNYAQGDFSFVGGGFCNQALTPGRYQTIGGGYRNYAHGTFSTIGGGGINNIPASFVGVTIGGGYVNYANNHVSTVGGGYRNVVDAFGATIGGGQANNVLGRYGTVGGGQSDSASGTHATVGGGRGNHAFGQESTIGGGSGNWVQGIASTIAGGERNIASIHPHQFIGGGLNNNTTNPFATISGGQNNVASTNATVGGGFFNQALGEFTFIGGGIDNVANAYSSVVAGGIGNISSNYATSIGGGENNQVLGQYSTIGGGLANFIQADSAVVGGGAGNSSAATAATVGGGLKNVAGGFASAVLGGEGNVITGNTGTIGGGKENIVGPGAFATVPGGFKNQATAPLSFAAGTIAIANDSCSFVWADCCRLPGTTGNTPFYSSGSSTFNARATNGFYFLTSCDSLFAPAAGIGSGVYVPAGGSMWMSGSSRTLKKNIIETDNRSILNKVANLPIYKWTYKEQDESIRHIGPMAEDFYATFNVGENDRTISSLDPAGVALAAIKELNEKISEVDKLKEQVNALTAQMSNMQMQMEKLASRIESSSADQKDLAMTK